MLKKLRTVIYHVNNLTEAKDFYSNLAGLRPYFDEPFYAGFDINGCELGLDPDMSGLQTGNHTTAYWAVDNIDAAVKKQLI